MSRVWALGFFLCMLSMQLILIVLLQVCCCLFFIAPIFIFLGVFFFFSFLFLPSFFFFLVCVHVLFKYFWFTLHVCGNLSSEWHLHVLLLMLRNNMLCDCWEIYSWSTDVFKGEPNQRRITGPIHRDGTYIYVQGSQGPCRCLQGLTNWICQVRPYKPLYLHTILTSLANTKNAHG